MLLKFFIEVA